jgi:hypothetical protein
MSLAVRLAAACLLAAAAGVVPSSSAEAATCASGAGVSVVVDFHELPGGVQTACVADGGGKSGTALFTSAGFALGYVQRQPGFVCRVNGAPANDPCVNTPPADAYWGLWWSDGKSGQWTYATTAAGGLSVPDGGYVAFSWNGSATRSTPGVSPAVHATAPTPTSKPTSKPSTKPSSKPTKKPSSTPTKSQSTKSTKGASSSPSSTESTSATPSPTETTKAPSKAGQPTKSPGGVDGEMLPDSTAPAPSDSAESADAAPASSDPADPSDDGLPTWVGPLVVVALFAAGGAVAVVRRRRSPTP